MPSSVNEEPRKLRPAGITAEQFREAATASGRTMQELGALIGVSRAQVYNYLSNGVTSPPRTVEQVRRTMGIWLRDADGNPFDRYNDEDLVREVRRRLARISDMLEQSSPHFDSEQIDDADGPGDGDGRYTGTLEPPTD